MRKNVNIKRDIFLSFLFSVLLITQVIIFFVYLVIPKTLAVDNDSILKEIVRDVRI